MWDADELPVSSGKQASSCVEKLLCIGLQTSGLPCCSSSLWCLCLVVELALDGICWLAQLSTGGRDVSCIVDTANEMVTQSHNLFNIASAFSCVCCHPLLRARAIVKLVVCASCCVQEFATISRGTRVLYTSNIISPALRRRSQQPRRGARQEEAARGGDKGIQLGGGDRTKQSAVSSESPISPEKCTTRTPNRIASVLLFAVLRCPVADIRRCAKVSSEE